MNKRSVSHEYVQNQHEPSWIDDPFETKGWKTGVVPVNHQRNLDNYVLELVGQYGKYHNDQYELSLEMLPDDEQNELVRLYIESIDRNIEDACYGKDASINNDFLCSLLRMLKSDSYGNRQQFAEQTRNNLIDYYKDNLNELLVEGADIYLRNQMNEQGLYARYDLEHGDVVWSKF